MATCRIGIRRSALRRLLRGVSALCQEVRAHGCKFGDQLHKGGERTHHDLGVTRRLPSILVDHLRGLVARPVRDPRLGLALGKGDRDERRAEVVDADRSALLVTLEELVPRAAGPAEVPSEFFGSRRAGKRRPCLTDLGWVHEHARLRRRLRVEVLLPDAESFGDGGVQRPGPGVIGLVAIQIDDPVLYCSCSSLSTFTFFCSNKWK